MKMTLSYLIIASLLIIKCVGALTRPLKYVTEYNVQVHWKLFRLDAEFSKTDEGLDEQIT